MAKRLRVTLTATSNPYLAPSLPLTGTLEIGEINLYGGIVWATFKADGLNAGGFPNPPVEVKEIEFSYAKPDYAALSEARIKARHEQQGAGLSIPVVKPVRIQDIKPGMKIARIDEDLDFVYVPVDKVVPQKVMEYAHLVTKSYKVYLVGYVAGTNQDRYLRPFTVGTTKSLDVVQED